MEQVTWMFALLQVLAKQLYTYMITNASIPEFAQRFANFIRPWVFNALRFRQSSSLFDAFLTVEVKQVECFPLLNFILSWW